MTFSRQADEDPLYRRSARTIFALILREMSTTYGRTPGGYLWAVAEPVAGIALFTIVMSEGLRIRTPGLGTNFPLFYATGILPFQMFTSIANAIARAITFSRSLLAYPEVTYMDAMLARFSLQVLTKLMVSYLVLAGILIIFETGAILNFAAILNAFAMTALLGFGIGSVNAYLRPVFPVWEQLWGILTTPLFLLSGVFFLYDDLPPFARAILWYNPLVHVIGEMRRGFYATYAASYVSPAYVYGIALTLTAVGLLLLRRHHRAVANV